MTDFTAARRMMVDGQIRPADVTDLRLIDAMFEVPRESFLPAVHAGLAYLDLDAPANDSGTRRLLKPMVLAKLIYAADLAGTDRVLDVGCASGYSSAILGRLAADVVALEEDAALAGRAAVALRGQENVTVVTGPLVAGWSAAAPYNVIVVNGACDVPPSALCDQLANGGRLVCVVGSGPAGKATLFRRDGNDIGSRRIFDATAPLLPGFARAPAFSF
jgi:protein-L-isoaspartate(D-aspartate) O-methyltransferase